jgi:hypothetical protein
MLLAAAGLLVIVAAQQSKKLRKSLTKPNKKVQLLPKIISLFVISAQASELLKVLDHVTITNVAATLFLLVILVASKSGTKNELY